MRISLGEFNTATAVETSAAPHEWIAADSFAIQFELTNGAVGVIQSSVGTHGPPVSLTRVSGTAGTAWVTTNNDVMLTDVAGTEESFTGRSRVDRDWAATAGG